MDTARPLDTFFDTAFTAINAYISEKGHEGPGGLYVIGRAKESLKEVGAVLGLFMDDPADYFRKDRDREARKLGLDIGEIEGLVKERTLARAEKNWDRADRIGIPGRQKNNP